MASKFREATRSNAEEAEGGLSVAPVLPHRTLDDVRGRLEGAVETLMEAREPYRTLRQSMTQARGEQSVTATREQLQDAAELEPRVESALARVYARAAAEGWDAKDAVMKLAREIEVARERIGRRLGVARSGSLETGTLAEQLLHAVPWGQEAPPQKAKTTLRLPVPFVLLPMLLAVFALNALLNAVRAVSFTTAAPMWLLAFEMAMAVVMSVRVAHEHRWFSVQRGKGERQLVLWEGGSVPRGATRFVVTRSDRLRIREIWTVRGRKERALYLVRHGEVPTYLCTLNESVLQADSVVRALAVALGCEVDDGRSPLTPG